jgi:hypothetical protein
LHGFAPFVRETENESLLALQFWTAVLTFTTMALSEHLTKPVKLDTLATAIERVISCETVSK